MNCKDRLEKNSVAASVPCRIDLGGTLDISTFYLQLMHYSPSSFNIALDLRTHVTLLPWKKGYVKISSKGFETAEYKKEELPLLHPMGLMFAIARYFNAHGVYIRIESNSPPRSALGGSSSAAVAMIAAFFKLLGKKIHPEQIAWLAHYIEASVAGVPCGMQDQLAAAFGGVHQWIWKMGKISPVFEKKAFFTNDAELDALNQNILIAYCGIPHVSKDSNKQWIDSFIKGETRPVFEKISSLTQEFSLALKAQEYIRAGALMNQETKLRLEMTPDVLDNTGKKLFEKAVNCNCGARFTGAGGGGCLWAVGEKMDIERLQPLWQDILSFVKNGRLLDTKIDKKGILLL